MAGVGLIANPNKPGTPALVDSLAKKIRARSFDVRIAPPIRDLADCDLAFVLGGDGTLLHAVRELDGAPVPLFGINTGSLGFLTEVAADDIDEVLDEVLDGRYEIVERPLLTARIAAPEGAVTRTLHAMNDIVVDEGSPTRRAVRLCVTIGDEEMGTFTADGVVVATPAGSTAYNLSAGGPVLGPDVRALVATPICPHTMAVRPLVYPDTKTLRVEDIRRGLQVKVTADGQVYAPVPEGGAVSVAVDTKRVARFASLKRRTYFEILRTRLRWGGGERRE